MDDQGNSGGGAQPRPGSLASRLGATITIVVIEDESDMARSLGAYFRASGMNLESCCPAETADVLDAIFEYDADCVVVDFELTSLRASEILEALRADRRCR
jgi:DNA-binding response OmpR family regulator